MSKAVRTRLGVKRVYSSNIGQLQTWTFVHTNIGFHSSIALIRLYGWYSSQIESALNHKWIFVTLSTHSLESCSNAHASWTVDKAFHSYSDTVGAHTSTVWRTDNLMPQGTLAGHHRRELRTPENVSVLTYVHAWRCSNILEKDLRALKCTTCRQRTCVRGHEVLLRCFLDGLVGPSGNGWKYMQWNRNLSVVVPADDPDAIAQTWRFQPWYWVVAWRPSRRSSSLPFFDNSKKTNAELAFVEQTRRFRKTRLLYQAGLAVWLEMPCKTWKASGSWVMRAGYEVPVDGAHVEMFCVKRSPLSNRRLFGS